MIVTISQFRSLAKDEQGNTLPLGDERISCEARTAAGAFAPLASDCAIVRLATDTNIRMNIEGGTTDGNSELFLVGVEYISVDGGETLNIAVAV